MFVSMAAVTTLGQTGEGGEEGREGRYHAQCQKCGCEPCHAIHTLWLNLWYRMAVAGRGQIEHHITSSARGVSLFHRLLPSPKACAPLALPLIALLHLDTPPPSFPGPANVSVAHHPLSVGIFHVSHPRPQETRKSHAAHLLFGYISRGIPS